MSCLLNHAPTFLANICDGNRGSVSSVSEPWMMVVLLMQGLFVENRS